MGSTVSLSQDETIGIVAVYSLIGLATFSGFVLSAAVGRLSVVLAGLGIVTFVFGLRHGVDADHIAAIDNTTRKLMQDSQKPFTVGMWFSLGHSTIVVGLTVSLIFATRAVIGYIPILESGGAIIGITISGAFLW
jgi:high-affinity nickel-transport protein